MWVSLLREHNRRPLLRNGFYRSDAIGMQFATFRKEAALSRDALNQKCLKNFLVIRSLADRRREYMKQNPHELQELDKYGRVVLKGECLAPEIAYTDQLHYAKINVKVLE